MTYNDFEFEETPLSEFWRGVACGVALTLGGAIWVFLLSR